MNLSPRGERERNFQAKHINPILNSVLRLCQDSRAHAIAKDMVPISEIVQDNLDVLEDDYYLDNLLPHLVDWFKSKFFTWFSPPTCDKCSCQLVAKTFNVNSEGLLVECYSCPSLEFGRCPAGSRFEFTRHKDPKVLLQTRTGRCGEWADCFFLILRALDYDARLVHDSSDHVWNEVWSEKHKRWLHVDSCEGAIDAPLLYEVGWSKKLEYCLAFSRYSAIDVTRRYCIDWSETLATRRKSCNEKWLCECLEFVSEELIRTAASNEVRNQIRTRRKQDCDFLARLAERPQKIPNKGEFQQRKTGSISWRIERGEYSPIVENRHVIVCSAWQKQAASGATSPLFELSYNCYRDKYEINRNEQLCSSGWLSMTYRSENIDRKHELDWHTCYLARYETCPHNMVGKLVWRFDLTKLEGSQERLEILLSGKVYPNTEISLALKMFDRVDCDEQPLSEFSLSLNETSTFAKDLSKVRLIELVASVSGGDESDGCAWQKPQLFRQTRNENEHACAILLRIF